MRIIFNKMLFGVISVMFAATCFAQTRNIINFNKDWRFKLGDYESWYKTQYDDSKWRVLNLPHDWSIEGKFSETNPSGIAGGALPGGKGWYRKTFVVPQSDKGKSIFIDFDGVYHRSEVWINGHHLGNRPNGYISFRYDLSPYINYGGNNVIAVKVNNSEQPNSRWYSGSGIYRNVTLVKTGKVFVPFSGTFITTPKVDKKEALIQIQTKIKNGSEKIAKVTLETSIIDPKGNVVSRNSKTEIISANGESEIQQKINLTKYVLWSLENPNLYVAETKVLVEGKESDKYKTNFGIRTFKFDIEKGFSLNGRSLKIRGVCNHHDLGALGAAFNVRAAERQLEILKDMGCNAIRTSHNPPAPQLLDLADKMGFIIMDEAFDIWAKQKSRADYARDFKQWHKKDLEDFIRRDRNHPSIFVWSVGNEIYEQWGSAASGDTSGRPIARELVSIVKSLDTTREITTANNVIEPTNNLIASGAFSMIGYNYHHQAWENFMKDYPGKKFIVTESTSALATRRHYDLVPFDSIRRWPQEPEKPIVGGGNPGNTVSAYDHVSTPWGSTHEESLKVFENHPHISGMFVWTGFDYLGEPTPYQWPSRSSYFGIMDLAGFPKDTYYLYKSVWSDLPVLHLYPHWNWQEGDTVDVVSYFSGADEVELFLNGKSLGTKHKINKDLHVKWRVPYVKGELIAVSRKAGQAVLTKTIRTAGEPSKIIMTADRNKIKASGEDLSFIKISVTDNDGNIVPDAERLIKFNVEGKGQIVGVDNGNPTSHESFKGLSRLTFNGLALAILKSSEEPGQIKVTAVGEGLKPAELIIKTE